jgi:hypothetical protein
MNKGLNIHSTLRGYLRAKQDSRLMNTGYRIKF